MNTNRNDPHRDVRLSAAYRDLQDTRTPTHLDEKVLQTAAREARTRYSLARAWTRPLAWAAVVVLCLTYALELTRVDDATDLTQHMDAPMPRAESPAPLSPAASPASLKRSQAPGKAEVGAAFAPAAVSEKATFAADDLGRIEAEALVACDESERGNPDDWYACILRLQGEGRTEAADREVEALQQAFPEFTIPAAHK